MFSYQVTWFLAIAVITSIVFAVSPGSFEDGGHTQVSAMMLFLGNDEKVYILDKAEMNAARINGHPAWGSVWDIASRKATVMDVRTNTFCSSGMHLPNGSYVTFGGNGAVGPGGRLGSQLNPGGFTSSWDSTIQDFDGGRSIRVLNPCKNGDTFSSPACQWYDEPSLLSMNKTRWYSAAEATGEGRVVIIGGFVSGGYVNRNYPNVDPAFEGGAAEPTYEYYPPTKDVPQRFQFLVHTSGLNAYAHTFLMPSGKMFVQANLSTVLWNYTSNQETPLPSMPNGVVRVYPASGATAMLPLTPANNYTPTILFCGGSDMSEYAYGNYSFPFINTWEYPASKDCRRITPEPSDGSAVAYAADQDMLEGRTMGQFIILPTGKLLLVNGGLNGTAGFTNATLATPLFSGMPYGESLASGPVLTPAIYDPDAPLGSRWSREGLNASTIPRLYHSSAILLPDASVLIAGSNPSTEVNLTAVYPTTYAAEIFYPPYFNAAATRPVVKDVPSRLSYGGSYFDVVVVASAYPGMAANDAADSAKVALVRPGFTTHAMNMGQRYVQLNNTYTVDQGDGSITLHVAQLPPNPNLFQPGPALLFVSVFGVPSNGSFVLVGNGQIGLQPVQPASVLPASVRLSAPPPPATSPLPNVTITGSVTTSPTASAAAAAGAHKDNSTVGRVVGAGIGCLALVLMIGLAVGMIRNRRGRPAEDRWSRRYAAAAGIRRRPLRSRSPTRTTSRRRGAVAGMAMQHGSDSSGGSDMFVPLRQEDRYGPASNPYLGTVELSRESTRLTQPRNAYAMPVAREYPRY